MLMLLSLFLGPVVTAEIVVALTGVSLLTKDGSRKSYSLFCLSIKMRHSTFFFFKVKDFPVHLMQGIVFSVKRARRQFY